MHTPATSARWAAVLALAAWALAPAVALAAPTTPKEDTKKEETAAEKLRKALDQPRDLDIVDQPLESAVNQLRDLTKINFVVDRTSLWMINPGDPTQQHPVTVKVKNAKLRTALRTMLSSHNLTFAVVGDQVLITTEDMAMYRQLKQRVSVDLDKVPLNKALKDLARETAVNLMLDGKAQKEAEAAVSLQLDDVPLETAVRLLSEMAGLKPVRMGNVLYVTTKANATELRSDPELAPNPNNPNNPYYNPPPIAIPAVPPIGPGGGGVVPPLPGPDTPPNPDKPVEKKDDKPKEDKPKDDR